MEEPLTALEALFRPRSVALVGASTTPGKIGSRIVDNLIDNGYTGRVLPINPRGGEVRGHQVYPDIASLPETAEVAYVLVPADAAVDAVRELGRAGTKAAIVAAAGFAEEGTDAGRAREAELARISAETGIRIVGPNCNGIYSATHSVSIGFNAAHGVRHRPGGVAVLSHSGAVFSTLMLRAREQGMGLSAFVSAGNECDLTVVDYLEHFAADEATTCISLIIDSVADGDRFRRAVAAAKANGKSVLALKLGTSETGASAAVAHSSRLAGSAAAYLAFMDHCGVGTVDTIEQLVAASVLIDTDVAVPARPRIGVLASSGGAGTIVADAAGRRGLELPPLSADSRRIIEERAPGALLENPVDLGGAQGRMNMPEILDLLAADAGVDVVVQYYHPTFTDELRAQLAGVYRASQEKSGKPHLLLAPGGVTEAERKLYDAAGIPVMRDTDVCVAALVAAGRAVAPAAPRDEASAGLRIMGQGVLDEVTSTRLLSDAGVPMAGMTVGRTPAEVTFAARQTGWPVVVKGVVDGVAHKSDLGLVVVGVTSEEQARKEADRLFGLGASAVTVQPQVEGDIEALAGIVSEPGLGHFVVFGLGGVYTEALSDVAMVPAEAGRDEIRAALARTRLGAVLRSPRRKSQDTLDGFADVLERLAAFARSAGPRLEAIDINPLLVRGDEIVGVDALVVLRQDAPGTPAA
ncbi:hypothetical protein PZ61_0236000 [Streptomyces sp. MNU77]|uniref:acetate--CoA ligase family protein n=1 Tax=Streptomyces sp. MNU77 TaxID=1573406 RepID=UPI0005E61D87|nr:acetate--CoA ligase family protein [Streptomyces sp. MNU77]OLO25834.1 hypothetical protein PZ61_0236000 [Streptomyces sp. MNU77]